VRLNQLRLERPRQWGACWLADHPWRTLKLDDFFGARLPLNREGTDWGKVLRVFVIYRLLSPGSEWWLHRHGFSTTSSGDLLGVDERAAQDGTLYRYHDLLLGQKSCEAGFGHLRERWADLLGARYEVLLYDLTPTYFECDVPPDETGPRRLGYPARAGRQARRLRASRHRLGGDARGPAARHQDVSPQHRRQNNPTRHARDHPPPKRTARRPDRENARRGRRR